ncbi:MAG: Uma2 family endonuclease [Myxococcaceae bacterium]|nr:Uma2 family endonuclease [Myxococcaceae bacterium]
MPHESTARRLHLDTTGEYAGALELSTLKLEYWSGEIYAVAGGTPEHSALASKVMALLDAKLPAGCRTSNSDMLVRIASSDVTVFPDGIVVCGAGVGRQEGRDSAARLHDPQVRSGGVNRVAPRASGDRRRTPIARLARDRTSGGQAPDLVCSCAHRRRRRHLSSARRPLTTPAPLGIVRRPPVHLVVFFEPPPYSPEPTMPRRVTPDSTSDAARLEAERRAREAAARQEAARKAAEAARALAERLAQAAQSTFERWSPRATPMTLPASAELTVGEVALIPEPEEPGDLSAATYVAPTRRAELDEVIAEVVDGGLDPADAMAAADLYDPLSGELSMTEAELAYFSASLVDAAAPLLADSRNDWVGAWFANPALPAEVRLAFSHALLDESERYRTEQPLEGAHGVSAEEMNAHRATTLANIALSSAAGVEYFDGAYGWVEPADVDTATFNHFIGTLDPAQLEGFTQSLRLGTDWRSMGVLDTVSAVIDASMQDHAFLDGGPAFLFASTVLSGPAAPPDTAFNVFELSEDYAQTYVEFSARVLALEAGTGLDAADRERLRGIVADEDTRVQLAHLPFAQRMLVTQYLLEHDDFDASNVDDAQHGGLLGAVLVHRYATDYAVAQGLPFESSYELVLEEFERFNFITGAYASHLAVEAGWEASVGALRSGEPPRLSDGSALGPESYIEVDEALLEQYPVLTALVIPSLPPVLPHQNVIDAVADGTLSPDVAASILEGLAADASYRTHPDRLDDAGSGLFGEMAEGWVELTAGNPYSETGLHQHGQEQAARLLALAEQLRGSTDPAFVASAFTLGLDQHANVFDLSLAAFGESVSWEYGEAMGALGTAQLAATAVMVVGSLGAGLAAGSLSGGAAVTAMAKIAAVQSVSSFALNAASNWAETGDPHWVDALGAGAVDGFTTMFGMRLGMMRGVAPALLGGGVDVGGAAVSALIGQPGGMAAVMNGDLSGLDGSRVWNAALTAGVFSAAFAGGTYLLGGARGVGDMPRLEPGSALSRAELDQVALSLSDGTLMVRNAEGVRVPARDVIDPAAEGYYAVFRNQTTGEYDVRLIYASDSTSLDPMAAIDAQRSNWPGEGWEPVLGFHNHPNGSTAPSTGDLGADDLFRQVFGDGFQSAILTQSGEGLSLTPFRGNDTVLMPEEHLPWNGGQRFSDDPLADWSRMNVDQQLAAESGQTIDSLRSTWTPVAQDPRTGAVLYELPNGRRFMEYPDGDGDSGYRFRNVTDEVEAGAIPEGWMPIMSTSRITAQVDGSTVRLSNGFEYELAPLPEGYTVRVQPQGQAGYPLAENKIRLELTDASGNPAGHLELNVRTLNGQTRFQAHFDFGGRDAPRHLTRFMWESVSNAIRDGEVDQIAFNTDPNSPVGLALSAMGFTSHGPVFILDFPDDAARQAWLETHGTFPGLLAAARRSRE